MADCNWDSDPGQAHADARFLAAAASLEVVEALEALVAEVRWTTKMADQWSEDFRRMHRRCQKAESFAHDADRLLSGEYFVVSTTNPEAVEEARRLTDEFRLAVRRLHRRHYSAALVACADVAMRKRAEAAEAEVVELRQRLAVVETHRQWLTRERDAYKNHYEEMIQTVGGA